MGRLYRPPPSPLHTQTSYRSWIVRLQLGRPASRWPPLGPPPPPARPPPPRTQPTASLTAPKRRSTSCPLRLHAVSLALSTASLTASSAASCASQSPTATSHDPRPLFSVRDSILCSLFATLFSCSMHLGAAARPSWPAGTRFSTGQRAAPNTRPVHMRRPHPVVYFRQLCNAFKINHPRETQAPTSPGSDLLI